MLDQLGNAQVEKEIFEVRGFESKDYNGSNFAALQHLERLHMDE